MKKPEAKLVTFTRWCLTKSDRLPVSINPAEVSSVEDYCGTERPGSQIIMKNKKIYLVWGNHADIVARLNAGGEQ
jgi:hypothetical protein